MAELLAPLVRGGQQEDDMVRVGVSNSRPGVVQEAFVYVCGCENEKWGAFG